MGKTWGAVVLLAALGTMAGCSSSTGARATDGRAADADAGDAGPSDLGSEPDQSFEAGPGDAGDDSTFDAVAESSATDARDAQDAQDAQGDAATSGTCVATGSLTTPRSGAFVAALDNGKVLVAGGWSAGHVVATAELYDPVSATFTPTGSMTTAHGYTLTQSTQPLIKLMDGRVLMAGGYDDAGTALATSEIYDPASGSWSLTGSMVFPRENSTFARLPDGRVLALGGWSTLAGLSPDHAGVVLGGAPTSSAEIYDPGAGTWTQTANAVYALGYSAAARLKDGRILICSGSNPGTGSRNAETFSLASDGGTGGSFNAVGTLPAGGIGYFGSTIFALPNGQALVATRPSGPLALFNPTSDTFAPVSADLISAIQGISLKSGNVFLLTDTGPVATQKKTEIYQASTGTWKAGGNMTAAHQYPGLAELQDGSVLVIGGNIATAIATVDRCYP